MYCKEKIYSGTEEYSFEELRAARMFSRLAGRPWSALYPLQEPENKFKVMYPKKQVYTFEGELQLDEVLLKRYFERKKIQREAAQALAAVRNTSQVSCFTLDLALQKLILDFTK